MPARSARLAFTFSIEGIRNPTCDVRLVLLGRMPRRGPSNLAYIMFHKIDYPFLIGAFVSFLASVSLWFLVSHEYGLFVGIWVPSILSFWVGVRVVILSHGINTRKGR